MKKIIKWSNLCKKFVALIFYCLRSFISILVGLVIIRPKTNGKKK